MTQDAATPTIREEQRARLIAAFNQVYEQWIQDIGDAHDAWNTGELADAALNALEEQR